MPQLHGTQHVLTTSHCSRLPPQDLSLYTWEVAVRTRHITQSTTRGGSYALHTELRRSPAEAMQPAPPPQSSKPAHPFPPTSTACCSAGRLSSSRSQRPPGVCAISCNVLACKWTLLDTHAMFMRTLRPLMAPPRAAANQTNSTHLHRLWELHRRLDLVSIQGRQPRNLPQRPQQRPAAGRDRKASGANGTGAGVGRLCRHSKPRNGLITLLAWSGRPASAMLFALSNTAVHKGGKQWRFLHSSRQREVSWVASTGMAGL